MTLRVAVVGAGLAGLAAATRLREGGATVTVHEAEDHVGGRARTVARNGYLFDVGALTLSPAYRRTIALMGDVGAADLLVRSQPVLAIARDGIHEIDLARPMVSLLRSRLLPRRDLARLAVLLPTLLRTWKRSGFEDMSRLAPWDEESCGAFAQRVLGPELHDYLVDPLIRINMFADPADSSVVDLFWLLRIFADTHIVQVRGGIGRLAEVLAARLDVRTGAPVRSVLPDTDGVTVTDADGDRRYDAAIVATDPSAAAALTPTVDTPARRWLAAARPVRSITIQAGLRTPPASRAAMIMVPRREAPDVLAIALDHNKIEDRAPPGRAIVTMHMTGAWRDAHDGLDEAGLVTAALAAARPVLGRIDSADIEASHVQRWAFVDHQRSVGIYRAQAAAGLDAQRGRILFAGSSISSGLEGAVISGERCAATILGDLRSD